MSDMPRIEYREFGEGWPLVALHPLALESSVFVGLAGQLAPLGIRTLAVDLPGFGRTPAPGGPLTPAILAAPVLELIRSLDRPPILLGMSLGGRVALEIALSDPSAVRGVVGVAPYLPWRRWRALLRTAEWIDPAWAEHLRLERATPLLKLVTGTLDRFPNLQEDWLTRACVRVAYYSTCAATRTSLVSASRELALDPAFGPEGLWDRLEELRVPAAFVWAGRDRLIPHDHAEHVHAALPDAHWIEAACSGHFANARHFRCMQHAMTLAVTRVLEDPERSMRAAQSGGPHLSPCLAGPAPSRGASDPSPEIRRPVGAQGAAS
jgi:pimeloyl-ACP methyl ester carboxylesterase